MTRQTKNPKVIYSKGYPQVLARGIYIAYSDGYRDAMNGKPVARFHESVLTRPYYMDGYRHGTDYAAELAASARAEAGQ